jgi:aryl-alcohol dehydrogenase-like predicted oxidoreductase
LERNLKLLEPIRMIAEAKGATLAQIAIAWVLSRGKDIVPIIGARHRQSLAESLAALDVILSPEDLLAIEKALPNGTAAGSRYAEAQMAHLDSERG